MATFSNGESGFSVRTKINDVLQHANGTPTELVFNDVGSDVDFRIESDTQVNALFVDGATGNVGLGTGTPIAALHIDGASPYILINNTAETSSGILFADAQNPGERFQTVYNASDASFRFDRVESTGVIVERMRISGFGLVGIGTSAPAFLLDVQGADGTVLARFKDTDSAQPGFIINQDINAAWAGNNVSFAGEGIYYQNSINAMRLYTNSTERMRITATGLVGIGTSNPLSALEVSTTDGGSPTNTSPSAAVRLISTATAAVGAGPTILFRGQTGNATALYSFAAIQGFKEASGVNDYSGSLAFFTQNSGGASPLAEQMRITSTGNVGIGTASPAYRLHVLSASGFTSAFRASTAATTGILVGNTAGDTSIQTLASGDSLINSDTGKYLAFGTNGATERMRIDSAGNLALGATPNTGGYGRAFEIVHSNFGGALTAQAISADNYPVSLTSNAVTSGPNTWKYMNTASATRYDQVSGQHRWIIAPSGTAGAAISFTQAMTLDASGNLGINTVTPTNRLQTVTTPPAAVPAAGAAGHALAVGTTPYGVASGALNDGRGYIQATRWDGTATNYSLLLQPNGGSVGIGVANPTANLQIGGVAGGDRTFQMGSSGATRGVLATSGSGTFAIGATNDSTAGSLVFQTGGALAERMRINELGDVGIGTISPGARLHVNGGGIFITTSGTYSEPATVAGIIAFDSANGDLNISARSNGGNAYTRFFTSSAGAGAERARITPTGDLLVGTTTVNGAASNAAVVLGGGFRTANGLLSAVASGVATTAFSITAANRGRYEVVAMIVNSGDASLYSAISTVLWDGSTGRAVSNNGTNFTITLSGSNVQVTQTSGSAQNIFWSFQRIAL